MKNCLFFFFASITLLHTKLVNFSHHSFYTIYKCHHREKDKYLTIIMKASLVAQTVKHLPAMRETRVRSLGQEDPLEKENGNPLQYSCLENPMDGGAS